MGLKVGMYVRTKSGFIFKITGGNEDNLEFDYPKYILECFDADWLELYAYNDNYSYFRDNVVKASYNIIDLIEVGDYVNGYPISDIVKQCNYIALGDENLTLAYKSNYDKYTITSEDIKTVITHEQMQQMEYRIGEINNGIMDKKSK
jgi:hypothetical protein